MLRSLISENPVLLLFLVLGIGYVIGGIRFGSFQLGAVAGVLLAGLLLGHLGFESNPAIQSLGFVLFIFSVGYQAGPKFVQGAGQHFVTDFRHAGFIRRVHAANQSAGRFGALNPDTLLDIRRRAIDFRVLLNIFDHGAPVHQLAVGRLDGRMSDGAEDARTQFLFEPVHDGNHGGHQ